MHNANLKICLHLDVPQDDSVNVGAEAAAMEIDPSFSSTSADETGIYDLKIGTVSAE